MSGLRCFSQEIIVINSPAQVCAVCFQVHVHQFSLFLPLQTFCTEFLELLKGTEGTLDAGAQCGANLAPGQQGAVVRVHVEKRKQNAKQFLS